MHDSNSFVGNLASKRLPSLLIRRNLPIRVSVFDSLYDSETGFPFQVCDKSFFSRFDLNLESNDGFLCIVNYLKLIC